MFHLTSVKRQDTHTRCTVTVCQLALNYFCLHDISGLLDRQTSSLCNVLLFFPVSVTVTTSVLWNTLPEKLRQPMQSASITHICNRLYPSTRPLSSASVALNQYIFSYSNHFFLGLLISKRSSQINALCHHETNPHS